MTYQYPLSSKSCKVVNQWKDEKSKPLFIYGFPGTGKTTLANHLLKDYHIININSDQRKCKGCLKKFIQDSLYKKDILMMLHTSHHYKALLIDDLQYFVKNEKGNISKLLDIFTHNTYENHPIIII